MNTTTHPTSDLEALSALFDGELTGDPARFALKRLDHDQAWRGSCERWSLVGDVLRGQGHALLPAGFPARVRAAAIAPAPAPAPGRAGRWAAWGGAGLAASVAAVALFFARQSAEVEAPQEASAGMAAAVPVAASPVAAPLTGSGTDRQEAAPSASAGPALAVAAQHGPRRVGPSQRGRTATPRPARRAMSAGAQPVQAVAAAAPLAPPAGGAATPFAGQPPARPWPRAVLPQFGGNGALTTDFGAPSPSFYPFQPRLPADAADAADAAVDTGASVP